jgi:hypothetical protein
MANTCGVVGVKHVCDGHSSVLVFQRNGILNHVFWYFLSAIENWSSSKKIHMFSEFLTNKYLIKDEDQKRSTQAKRFSMSPGQIMLRSVG